MQLSGKISCPLAITVLDLFLIIILNK
jgi:hypothetical protein